MRKKEPLLSQQCGSFLVEVHDDFNDENGVPCELWIKHSPNEFIILPIADLKALLKKAAKFKPTSEDV